MSDGRCPMCGNPNKAEIERLTAENRKLQDALIAIAGMTLGAERRIADAALASTLPEPTEREKQAGYERMRHWHEGD